MAGKERMRLTDAAIARHRPREREYTVWDTRMAGLGVRVRPSGGRSWIFLRKTDGGTRRISLGPVELKTVEEVRERGQAGRDPPCCPVVPGLRRRHMERGLLRPLQAVNPKERAIHPCQATAARLRIETAGPHIPTRVRRWFDIYSRTAPGGANRALDLLRQIMNVAVACGHVDSNPARGVKRNRRPALTRFLSREEIGRLHRVLDRQTRKSSRQQADIIRLLLLTGCRKGEIVRLRWSAVQDDILVLADSKTGPRKVPLNTQARRILERQPRGASSFVFPSPRDPARPRGLNLALWYRVRQDAGIEDVRLHDLRHTHASHAVMNGVPVPVVSRLLGHSNVSMTLRYAHLGDRDVEAAAERVGQSIGAIMGI